MAETERPVKSRCNLNFFTMSKSGKSFRALVSKMEQLQEKEQGKLIGGFSSLSSLSTHYPPPGSDNSAICSCTINIPCKRKGINIFEVKGYFHL